ncbi:MAG: cupin domain-containing protein [Chitinophagaceae bacterium]|nr:cupin domain-containing protein [Chitinophagaceae bacterium]
MKSLLTYLLLCNSFVVLAQRNDSLPSKVFIWDSIITSNEETRVRRQIMDGGTTSLERFIVHASTVQPGKASHAPHVHDDMEELIIVKEGEVRITIKGVTRTLGPGSVAFAMPGDEHGIENSGNSLASYYILRYKSKLPSDMNRASQNGGSFFLDWNDLTYKLTEKGGRREFFNRPTSQLAKFEMHTTALRPGLDSHAPHTHKEEELVILLQGNVEMYIAGQLYKMVPGDLVFLSSGVSHALKNTGKELCEYFAFQWKN